MPLQYRSISASIRVGGKDLEVYQPEFDEKTQTATAWIISEPGKEYTICYKADPGIFETHLAGQSFVDGGTNLGGGISRRGKLDWVVQKGARVSNTETRPFIFARLMTSDNPRLLSPSATPKDPGTILLKIERVAITKENAKVRPISHLDHSALIDEKTKKGGTHVTQFGKPLKATSLHSLIKNLDRTPWVTFVFRYRPEAILQANGIVPHVVGNGKRPREDDDDEDEDDEDVEEQEAEIYALQAKLKARVQALAARKKVKVEEVEATMSGKGRQLKQEEEIVVMKPGEVIDLTEDD